MKKIKSPTSIIVFSLSLSFVCFIVLVVILYRLNNYLTRTQEEPPIIRLLTGNRYDSIERNKGRPFFADYSGYYVVKTESDIVSNAIHVDALTHSLKQIEEEPNDDLCNWIKDVRKENETALDFDPNENHISYLYTADAVFRSVYIVYYPEYHTALFFLCSFSPSEDDSEFTRNYLTEKQYTILVRGYGPADGFSVEYGYVLLQTDADVLSNIEHLRALNSRIVPSGSPEANYLREIDPPFPTVDEIIKDPHFSPEVRKHLKNDSVVYRYYDDPECKEVVICYSPQTKALLIIYRNVWWEPTNHDTTENIT